MEAVLFDQWTAAPAPAPESGMFRTSLLADSESVVGKTRFALDEIKFATNGFAVENVIGSGDHAVVYQGVLQNNVRVAVKRLLCGSLEDEEFKREAEVISHIRHKNLVKLLGYCADGETGWLSMSMLIMAICISGFMTVVERLAFIHEDTQPKLVHCNIKSSNILLDHQWNPRISDIGLAELYEPEQSHCQAKNRVMAAAYDVYCFGVLVMEIVSGRLPVDESQPQVHLVEWLKFMVANRELNMWLILKYPKGLLRRNSRGFF
ncbi:Protein kinase domain-containing protein [Psidium guajava]|nr:Protein kinase domain-containing protein [Psidium guajava]